MKNQGINKSVLAMLLASTSTAQEAVASNNSIQNNPQLNIKRSPSPSIYRYVLAAPARYNDPEHGYVDGKILLNIQKANVTPKDYNSMIAEFQGELYFFSNSKIGNYSLFIPIGGEDGQIILDLINSPNKNDTYKPLIYNFHGCNSTITTCSPMALQLSVYQNGAMTLTGRLGEKIEINYKGHWVNSFYNEPLISPHRSLMK